MEFSYLPIDVGVQCPHIVMMNDRQLKKIVVYLKRNNTLQLCVTFKGTIDAHATRDNSDLNKERGDDTKKPSGDTKE